MDQVSVQPSLGTERLKVGENVIAQGSHVPALASSRTWKLQLQKKKKKGAIEFAPKTKESC